MKCPLHKLTRQGEGTINGLEYADCLKGECAWWSPIAVTCALRAIDLSLLGCHLEMVKIAKELTLVRGK